ncbi:F-box domain-containing protein [Colletotrichum graminicola]|uniref:F-box domain-containing protein n=1 Tax=Colletotrichum graminicola (strain M1.001 / M2 / FGSC 10212) TaxID=645133 RepID=E3QJV8_COLGM|nr:F-box domain-containing protein [Colletotrichum graminicola M1.001]EFQ31146.1 F-box domain-containing protein [Colletotrichum graminicola M1.001]WDK10610.1 F-box domain-containing protein [Colletotrichum graminicola]
MDDVVRSFGRGVSRAARSVRKKVQRDQPSSDTFSSAAASSPGPSLAAASPSAEATAHAHHLHTHPHALAPTSAPASNTQPDLEAQHPTQTATHSQYTAVPLASPPPFTPTAPEPASLPAHNVPPHNHVLPTLTLGPSAQYPNHDNAPPHAALTTHSIVIPSTSDAQALTNNITTQTLTVPGTQSQPVSPLSPPPAALHSPSTAQPSPSFTPSAISFAPQIHPNSPSPQPLNLSAAASPAQYIPSPLESPLPLELEQQISGKDGGSIRPQSARPRTSRSRRDSVIEKVASLDPRRRPRSIGPKTGNSLMDLPPELHLMIIDYLEFGELENLRRTCRFYRNFLTKQTIRDLFGEQFRLALLAHCYICLKYDPTRGSLLWADYNHPRYPLASKCVDCAYQEDELAVGKKVALGNYASVWICRWCGYPVASAAAPNQPEFHKECYSHYNNVLLVYFVLGWIQISLGIVASGLCWRFFRDETLVLVAAIVNFVLLWWCLAFLVVRGEHKRTYHFTGILEAAILGLWCLPLYVLVNDVEGGVEGAWDRRVLVTLIFIVLNMAFRMLNLLGNIILTLEWRHFARKKPRLTPAGRFANTVLALLVYWTYPQAVEQEYPPQYHFINTGRRRVKRILAERNAQRQRERLQIMTMMY